jgi:hypothetical protein
MTDIRRSTGALQTPPEILAQAWPIGLALAEAPVPAPASFHSPKCQHITIDQDGFGACVAYSGAYVQADQEPGDLPNVIDPLHAYALVKGLPWPLINPKQDANPGLDPVQLWSYTKAHGWPTKDGSAPRKDASYLMIGKPGSNAVFLDAYQQTLLQLGPCQFTAAWPNNWWNTNTAGYMPNPGPTKGGHAFEGCGWVPCSTCRCGFDTIHHQTWGTFGHDPDYPDHFRVHGDWWDNLGWEAWKAVDLINPAPVPVIARTPFPAPRQFFISKGTTLVGFDPAYPDGRFGRLTPWPFASSAHADAVVYVTWPGFPGTSAPFPRGGPYLEVADGVYGHTVAHPNGLLVNQGQVRLV